MTDRDFYDTSVVERARRVRASALGELETTDLNRQNPDEGLFRVELMGWGMAWLEPAPATRCTRRPVTTAPFSTARGSRWAVRRRWPGAWAGSTAVSWSGYGDYLMQLLELEPSG